MGVRSYSAVSQHTVPRTSSEVVQKCTIERKNEQCRTADQAGRGSHRKVQLGHARTIVPIHGSELKTGTLKAILRDLGVNKDDL